MTLANIQKSIFFCKSKFFLFIWFIAHFRMLHILLCFIGDYVLLTDFLSEFWEQFFFSVREGHMGNYAKISQQYCRAVLICKQLTCFLNEMKWKNQILVYIIKRTRFIVGCVFLLPICVVCDIWFNNHFILFKTKNTTSRSRVRSNSTKWLNEKKGSHNNYVNYKE